MLKRIATIISYIFQPIFISFYSIIIAYYLAPEQFLHPSTIQYSLLLATIFINTLLFPLFAIIIMKKLQIITSLEMYERTERFIPLIAIMVFYIWCAVAVYKMQAPYVVQILTVSSTITIALSFFVTIYIKSSLHAAAMSSSLAFFIILFPLTQSWAWGFLLFWVLCLGAVGTSRLVLKAHTLKEIITGYSIGLVGVIFGLLLLKYIYGV